MAFSLSDFFAQSGVQPSPNNENLMAQLTQAFMAGRGPMGPPPFNMGGDMVAPPPQAGPGNLRPGINQGVQAPQGMMFRPDLNGRQQTRVNFLADQGREIGQKFLRPQTGGGLQLGGGMRPLGQRPQQVGQPMAMNRRPDGNGGFLR